MFSTGKSRLVKKKQKKQKNKEKKVKKEYINKTKTKII